MVAVEVGGDITVFADAGPAKTIDVNVVLAGRTLADISADNFL